MGIGASAGGLEALEQFLGNVSENSGIAYIVVQHLDPTHKGMLPELLQRISKMKVFQVKRPDGCQAKLRVCYPPKQNNDNIKRGVASAYTCTGQRTTAPD